MEYIKNCPVCKNNIFKIFCELFNYKDNNKETYQVLQCIKCKLLFLNPRLDAELLKKEYNYTVLTAKKGKKFKDKEERLRYLKKNIAKYKLVKRYYRKKGKLLDIGCGQGDFLDFMKNYGWEVMGTELSNDLREKFDVPIIYGESSLKNLLESNNKFDVIIMWAVLQHIYNLEETLKDVFKLLKEDGILIILNNNSQCLSIRKLKYIDVPRMLYVFNKNNIEILLRKFNFYIKDIDFLISSKIFSSSTRGLILYYFRKKILKESEREIIDFYCKNNFNFNNYYKSKKINFIIKFVNILDKAFTRLFLDNYLIFTKQSGIFTVIATKGK